VASFNAIAAVSRTVRRLLVDRMATAGVAVTLAPPDVTVASVNGPRVNLYLYHAAEDAQLKNQNIPGHEHPAAFGLPPLSLSLRYLMTTHARSEDQPDSDLIAQSLMGDALLVLHDFGGRMDDMLLVTNRTGAIGDPLLDAELREEFERAKIVITQASVDELSKIWSAMSQANLRRSAVLEARVIQIEARRPRRQAQPVETRRLAVTVSRPPTIAEAYRTPPPPPADTLRDIRIAIGEELTIEHPPIIAQRLYVRLGTLEPIRIPLPSAGLIHILLPDNQYPVDLDHPAVRPIPPDVQLQPGPLEVTLLGVVEAEGVAGGLDRGLPFSDERALRSNTALLQIVPIVTATNPGFGTAAAILRVTGERLWAEGLPSQVIVGDASIPVRPPGAGDPWAAPIPTQVEIPVSAIAAILPPRPAPYQVAVQVGGARSRETGFSFRLDP
jgi:hypothetical protein